MTHHSPHKGRKASRTTVSEAGLSAAEQTVLAALRQFCMSYAAPDSFAWEEAFETCMHAFGPKHGPRIGLAVMNSVRALRSTRKTGFSFIDPACPCCRDKLVSHEHHFMNLIQAERLQDGLTRQTSAMVLCEGEDPGPVLKAITILAGHLAEAAAPSPAGRPKLSRRLRFTRP